MKALIAIDKLREYCPSADISFELEKLPAIAFAAGNEPRAIEAAKELLELVENKPKYRDVERITNEVHTVLGKIALKHGDLERARRHLHSSLPATTMRFIVPSFELARGLVQAGDSNDVISYLDRVVKICPPILAEAFKIRFQIEHGLESIDAYDDVDTLLRPKYEKSFSDYSFALLMNTEASKLKKVLECELERTRTEVTHCLAQIDQDFYTEICANICLEIHQQHLARLEKFASELNRQD